MCGVCCLASWDFSSFVFTFYLWRKHACGFKRDSGFECETTCAFAIIASVNIVKVWVVFWHLSFTYTLASNSGQGTLGSFLVNLWKEKENSSINYCVLRRILYYFFNHYYWVVTTILRDGSPHLTKEKVKILKDWVPYLWS